MLTFLDQFQSFRNQCSSLATRIYSMVNLLDNVQNALRGRENPLPDLAQNPDFTRDILETSVERELQEQFNVST